MQILCIWAINQIFCPRKHRSVHQFTEKGQLHDIMFKYWHTQLWTVLRPSLAAAPTTSALSCPYTSCLWPPSVHFYVFSPVSYEQERIICPDFVNKNRVWTKPSYLKKHCTLRTWKKKSHYRPPLMSLQGTYLRAGVKRSLVCRIWISIKNEHKFRRFEWSKYGNTRKNIRTFSQSTLLLKMLIMAGWSM